MIDVRGHEIHPFMPRTLNRTPIVGTPAMFPLSTMTPSLSVQSYESTVKEPGRTSYHMPSCNNNRAMVLISIRKLTMNLLWYACNSRDAGTSIGLGGRDQHPTRPRRHISQKK